LLEKRADKGDTPYNLRNCAYMEDFYKQKIIYPEITKFLNFYLDNLNFVTNNKCFILTGKKLNYLTAFLNSSLFKYCFKDDFPELLGGTRELRKVFLEQIPIKMINDAQEKIFEELITLFNNSPHIDQKLVIAKKIDQLIFDVYELTLVEREEIGFIQIT